MSFNLNTNKEYSIDEQIKLKEYFLKEIKEKDLQSQYDTEKEYEDLLTEFKEKGEDTTTVERVLSEIPERIHVLKQRISTLEKEILELKTEKDKGIK